jgi:hypothetical protein
MQRGHFFDNRVFLRDELGLASCAACLSWAWVAIERVNFLSVFAPVASSSAWAASLRLAGGAAFATLPADSPALGSRGSGSGVFLA